VVEILRELGTEIKPGMMTYSELLVGFVIGISAACIVVFKSNRWGFLANSATMMGGFLTIGLVALSVKSLSAFVFLVMTGIGVNLIFVPMEAGFFERLIAFLRMEGASASFPVQITGTRVISNILGTVGYAGGITIFILSSTLNLSPLAFFELFSMVSATVGLIMMVLSSIYLMIIKPRQLQRKRVLDETVDIIEHGFDKIDSKQYDV
jgi:hypothetical protein